jgi:putative oxidoreductase
MAETRELNLLVDETPTGISRLLTWFARMTVVAAFLFIGMTKFNSDPRGEWFKIFARIGWGQWFRVFTGIVQVAGALLLTTRRTITIGAALLGCTMIGAAFVDVVVMHSAGIALVPLTLLGIIAATWFAAVHGATRP